MGDTPDYTRQNPPQPVAGAVSSHDLVIEDLKNWEAEDITATTQALLASRKKYGFDKYGVLLHKDNGRDHALDAEDESCDKAVYLRTMMDAGGPPREWVLALYRQELWSLVCLHTWRTEGVALDHMMARQGPITELAHEAGNNVHPEIDDGRIMWFEAGVFGDGPATWCGAAQVDLSLCARGVLAQEDDPDAPFWCPRHGARQVFDMESGRAKHQALKDEHERQQAEQNQKVNEQLVADAEGENGG